MDGSSGSSALRPGLSLVFSVLTAIIGFVIIGQLAGILIGGLFYEGTMIQWIGEFTNSLQISEKIRLPLLIMQGCGTAFGLILTPWLYLRFIEKISVKTLFENVTPVSAAVTVLAVGLFMFPNSVLIEWNHNFTFPGAMDKWVRDTEETAAAFTRFLTSFTSFGNYLLGLLVIAVIPAIGEELAFRGMIQPAVQRVTGNIHVAVWVTAAFFSAFHFQFLGFMPRLMLGAFFGYLLIWSGNLWLPVIAHFANNAIGVTLMYLNKIGITDIDAESPDAAPWSLVIPGTVFFLVLAGFIRKKLMQAR